MPGEEAHGAETGGSRKREREGEGHGDNSDLASVEMRGASDKSSAVAEKKGNEAAGGSKNTADSQPKAKELTSFVQILGADNGDCCPSVQIFTGAARLLFNAGDGLQRFCTQHQIRMTKLEHMFLTRVDADTVGGLLGMYLTLSETGVRRLIVHGPPGTSRFIQGGGAFCENRADSKLEAEELSDAPLLKPSFTVSHVIALPPPPAAPPPSETDEADPRGGKKRPVEGRGAGVSYLVRLPDEAGRLDAAKAAELGVPPGPLLGKLKNGLTVTLPDGTVVIAILDCPSPAHLPSFLAAPAWRAPPPKPEGGKGGKGGGGDKKGGAKRQKLGTDTGGGGGGGGGGGKAEPAGGGGGGEGEAWDGAAWEGVPVACVIHFSPPEVLSDRRYMERSRALAGSTATHVVLNAALCPEQIAFPSHHKILSKLSGIDAHFFPLPHTSSPCTNGTFNAAERRQALHTVLAAGGWAVGAGGGEGEGGGGREGGEGGGQQEGTEERLWREGWGQAGEVVGGRVLLKYGVAPARNAGWEEVRWWEEYDGEGEGGEAKAEEAEETQEVQEEPEKPEWMKDLGRDRMEVVMLGTAASVPGKYRNVSGIFVDLFDRGGIILDCGEGSFGQLLRKYGRAGGFAKLEALSCVWVSHMHADHHLGLLRVLSHRAALARQRREKGEPALEKLTVIGPPPLRKWLGIYQAIEEGIEIDFVDNARLFPGKEWVGADSGSVLSGLLAERLQIKITTVHVRHSCRDACGVALENTDGPPWKLVYSGDTRPCKELVALGQGATLLIHEATFENTLEDDAKFKQHSTTEEALRIGRQMGAYRTLLSHFSQRYAKAPVLSELEGANAGVAFDLMAINLSDLPRLPSLLAPLSRLCKLEGWQTEYEEEE